MKASPGRQAETITALRAAFGAGDFRARDIVNRTELSPLVQKLVGRRGDVCKRIGRWLRLHDGAQYGELTLRGEFRSHRRRWVWAVEHPNDGPSPEAILQTAESSAREVARKLAAKPGSGLRGEIASLNRQSQWLERQQQQAREHENELQRQLEEDQMRERRRQQRREAQRMEKASAPRWAVHIKARRETIDACIDAVRDPYHPQLIDGAWLVQCSQEHVHELAARLHTIVATHKLRGLARAVVIGETPQQRAARQKAAKLKRAAEARERLNHRFRGDAVAAETLRDPIRLNQWRFEF